MQNIIMSIDKNILTLTIDLSKRGGLSKSGKTISIASTEGNISIPEHKDIKIGVNAYVKNLEYKGE